MKLQTIKNKLYEQMDMKPDMVGRIFINEAINNAVYIGRFDAMKEEVEFLEAIKKWHSWERMSIFAKDNIEKRIYSIKNQLKNGGLER